MRSLPVGWSSRRLHASRVSVDTVRVDEPSDVLPDAITRLVVKGRLCLRFEAGQQEKRARSYPSVGHVAVKHVSREQIRILPVGRSERFAD